MARKARVKNLYGTYLIKQFGGDSRPLFQDDTDRLKFIEILRKNKSKFAFKLFAYCLTDPNGYELIIYDNGSDISKIMKSINISYGMYANCQGKLFKDRYKSVLIEDFPSLLKMTRETKKKLQDSLWNSYCVYSDLSADPYGLIDLKDLLHLVNDNIDLAKESLTSYLSGQTQELLCDSSKTFCQEDEKCLTCKEDAHKKIQEIALSKGINKETLLKDKALRNALIRQFRKESTLSLKDLGQVFGGLSESSVCKILNSD